MKRDATKPFAKQTRVKSQVKRLEMGNYIASSEYMLNTHGLPDRIDEEIEFYVAFAPMKMGIKLYNRLRVEWRFEDIFEISIAEITLPESPEELEWIVITLSNPPQWNKKKKGQELNKNKGAWDSGRYSNVPIGKEARKIFTDIRTEKEFKIKSNCKDLSDEDPCIIHLALHSVSKTWLRYFQYPVQGNQFVNYNPALRQELLESTQSVALPFPEEAWCLPDQFCQNCDDESTKSKIFCLICKLYLCMECDIVLHKSALNVEHARRIVLNVPESLIKIRMRTKACKCQRNRVLLCSCADAAVYCGLDCKCQTVNLCNYKAASDEIEDGDERTFFATR